MQGTPFACFAILKGWESFSPGLRGTSYPGLSVQTPTTLKGLRQGRETRSSTVAKCARGRTSLRLKPSSALGFLALLPLLALATSPQLKTITPTGGQRGSEIELSFIGDRLQDAQEIICYG